MTLKVLKVSTSIDEQIAYDTIEANEFAKGENLGNYDLLKKVAKKAYDNSISTSMDLEVKGDLKKIADQAAIDVFGVNLKNLLLQPYLGTKAVLGIDPGIRTGCKIVVIDATGKFVGDHVIYPFAPKFDEAGSKTYSNQKIAAYEIFFTDNTA